MVEEMLAHDARLTDICKAVAKTQSDVAEELGISESAVAQLESRSELYFSTLRRFLKSYGMTLELSVISENGSRIELPNFPRLPDSDN